MGIKHKKTWIGGICTIVGTAIGAFGGVKYGEYIQEQYVQSKIVEVTGDDNTVTVNSVEDLVKEYNELLDDNETLQAQKDQYFEDYSAKLEENEALSEQLSGSPSIQLNDYGLYIDGSEMSVNKKGSYAVINGREYFSKDFLTSIAEWNAKSVSIQDDNLYLGKVVADSADLLKQRIVDSNYYEVVNSATDSYGNTHSNVGKFVYPAYSSVVYYSLK